jgi:hypothetical protein
VGESLAYNCNAAADEGAVGHLRDGRGGVLAVSRHLGPLHEHVLARDVHLRESEVAVVQPLPQKGLLTHTHTQHTERNESVLTCRPHLLPMSPMVTPGKRRPVSMFLTFCRE